MIVHISYLSFYFKDFLQFQMASGGGGDDNEWQKLPCDEKVQHKVLSD
jgi:hypothetical protein